MGRVVQHYADLDSRHFGKAGPAIVDTKVGWTREECKSEGMEGGREGEWQLEEEDGKRVQK